MLRSENVRGHEVVGEVGDGFLRVGRARVSSDGRHITARGSHDGVRRVGRHVKGVACALLCALLCASLCASFSRLPSFWLPDSQFSKLILYVPPYRALLITLHYHLNDTALTLMPQRPRPRDALSVLPFR